MRRSVCHNRNMQKSWKVGKYQYYSCTLCDSLRIIPPPKTKIIKETYSDFSYTTGFKNENNIRARSQIILKKCLQLNKTAKTILDIGCGAGFLLDEARRKGLIPTGLEPSMSLAKYAREELGLTIYDEYLTKETVKRLNGTFDIVILSHVIEHIPNPEKFLKLVSLLLSQNGILYIETPNYGGWLARLEKKNYTFLTPPEHVSLFSKRGLDMLLEDSNKTLKTEIWSTYSEPEHVVGAFMLLRKNRSIKLLRLPKLLKQSNTNKFPNIFKQLKYLLINKFLASALLPLFNFGGQGSYLSCYIRKK